MKKQPFFIIKRPFAHIHTDGVRFETKIKQLLTNRTSKIGFESKTDSNAQ